MYVRTTIFKVMDRPFWLNANHEISLLLIFHGKLVTLLGDEIKKKEKHKFFVIISKFRNDWMNS